MRQVQRAICLRYMAVVDVNAVLVLVGRVGAFPSSDAATTAPKLDVAVLDPKRAESIKEVGLAGDDAVVHVSVADLADVNLRQMSQE